MEASYCNAINNHFCSKPKTKYYYYSSIIPSSSPPPTTIIHTQKPKLSCFPVVYSWGSRPQRSLTAIGCSKGGGPANEIERELEDEWVGGMSGRWRDKWERGGRGIVELMECLEREAIMGEDEGREPTDYNRRAHIFDKSSTVFQALKSKESSSNPPTTSTPPPDKSQSS